MPFLATNLIRERRGSPGEVRAYLGDSGSHLLGMLVLMTPAAWPVLVLPLFDLARLCVVRTRAGSAPWVGDRRHLAHRLARSGLPRLAVPVALVLLALPAALLGWSGAPFTLALAAGALWWTADEAAGPGEVAAGAAPTPE